MSARPDNLDGFARTASGVYEGMTTATTDLGGALDDLRESAGWPEWLSDVPPLDIDLAAVTGRLDALGSGVAATAQAFRDAEGAVPDGGKATVEESLLGLDSLGVDMGPTVTRVGDRVIIDGTDGPDHVQVVFLDDGGALVQVGTLDYNDGHITYHGFRLTAVEARNMVIRTGGENDVIEVPPSATVNITVWAGDGDDLIGAGGSAVLLGLGGSGNDRLFGGSGKDRIFGGGGRDRIYGGDGDDMLDGQDGDDTVVAGTGDDVAYGGRDMDVLAGGDGDDYLEGGSGIDSLEGGEGDDALSGGVGHDHLDGGGGDDRLFGGRGDDVMDGSDGTDLLVASDDDSDPAPDTIDRPRDPRDQVIHIALEGSPGDYAIWLPQPEWMSDADYRAWTERIDSDLELVRATPTGRPGLLALDQAARDSGPLPFSSLPGGLDLDRHVAIYPYGSNIEAADGAPHGADVRDWMLGSTENASRAWPPYSGHRDAMVRYDASTPTLYGDGAVPPVVVLYHELAHSYDQISGGVPEGTYHEVVYDRGDGIEVSRYEFHNAEWNAVGHDLDGDGSFDTLPAAGGRPHPGELTENALRDELGWDRRPYYGPPVEPDQEVQFEEVDR